jgi:hypothetical protein
MAGMETIKKVWSPIERGINTFGAIATGIGIIGMVIVVLTGHWDWRTAFFVLLIFTLVSVGVALHSYLSRVSVYMFRGVSKAERMCRADHYAAKRIMQARINVWDFAWQDDKESNPKTELPAVVRSRGSKALDDAIRTVIVGGSAHYNEILTTKAYLPLLKKHLGYCRELPPDKKLKYRARIYDNTKENYKKFPKMQFVIIDEEEVIFMSSGYEYCFSMRNKKTASVFLKYALIAWDQADEWKRGVKDIVIDSQVTSGFDNYLNEILSRIEPAIVA